MEILPQWHEYDHSIKPLLQETFPTLLGRFTNLDITDLRITATEVIITIPKESIMVDMAWKGTEAVSGKEVTILIEAQSGYVTMLFAKQFLTCAAYYFKERVVPIQIMVYFGLKPVNFESEIVENGVSYRYHSVWLQDYDAELFLASDNPSMMTLGFAARKANPADFFERYAKKILQIVNSKTEISVYFKQATALARFHKEYHIWNNIMINIKVNPFADWTKEEKEDDVLFKEGEAIGEAKGEVKGEAKIIKRLLASGKSFTEVMEMTKYTYEELNALLNEAHV